MKKINRLLNVFSFVLCILLLNSCIPGPVVYPPSFSPDGDDPYNQGADPTKTGIELTVNENDLNKYGRVTLNWTSPDSVSTYCVFRGNANIATCDKSYCWCVDEPYQYHFTDENVKAKSNYTYTIRNEEGIVLSNALSVYVPQIDIKEPTDTVPLVEGLVCAQKFWGTWIKMSTGVEYTVFENYVVSSENDTFAISRASTSSNLVVDGLGTFSVESNSEGAVLVDRTGVPYFRKGGVNIEYNMKVVGLKSSRAAATSSLKIKGKSEKYSSFETEKTVSKGETVSLTAPTAGDTQKITILTSDDEPIVVVPGIVISNSGDNMGTIAISDGKQYTLKVTGTIKDEDKTQGYLYSGIEYPLTLTLMNNSDFTIASSSLKIKADSPYISVYHKDGKSLDGIAVGKMVSESVDKEELVVCYTGTQKGYVDTGLIVEITNGETGDVWEDYIPLRFFSSVLPVTFSGESIKNNNSALNGFIIYPDGNSKFFAVRSGGKKTVYVPLFNSADEYIIAFSGATVTKNLDNTAEVFYGVNIGSTNALNLTTSGSEVTGYQRFGGSNHSIVSAYEIDSNEGFFEAYLSSGEADYYKFTAGDFANKSQSSVKYINFDTNYHITCESPRADKIIIKWELESGDPLSYVDLYVNGKKKDSININDRTYTVTGCKSATKYVIYFTDPYDSLVTVSNTCGITTSRLKYLKTNGDLWGQYDNEDGGVIIYFNSFDKKPDYVSNYEYENICIYRNNELYFKLSDFPYLYADSNSILIYKEYGFYMVFSLTGSQALNYTPKDGCFGFIDMTVEPGLQYTYHFRDEQGYRISDDITINCK